MEDIKFSTNWNNKLNCKAFTTIRLANPRKYFEGGLYNIYLKEKQIGIAAIMQIIPFKLVQLSDSISYLDTGYNKTETTRIFKQMYPNYDFEANELYLMTLLFSSR